MSDEMLDHLLTHVSHASSDNRAGFDKVVKHYVERALECVEPNEYVEDCLIHIDQAVERLFREPVISQQTRDHLMGAVEALRDELHLCDSRSVDRLLAAGT